MSFFARLFGPLLVKLGKQALKGGLMYLEKRYPASRALIEMILSFLEDARSKGDAYAVSDLHEHVSSFIDRADR